MGRQNRSKRWRALVSAVLCGLLIADQISWAAPVAGGTPILQGAAQVTRDVKIGAGHFSITVPRALGTVNNTYHGDSTETIILIQDAHINEQAQRRISELIRYFSEAKKINLVNVEGSEGLLNTSFFTVFPNVTARRRAADYLLANGRLSGSEYAASVYDLPIELYGVESEPLYRENLAAFISASEVRDSGLAVIEALKAVLSTVSDVALSSEQKDLYKARATLKKEPDGLLRYSAFLSSKAETLEIDTSSYAQLQLLLQLQEMEKSVNPELSIQEEREYRRLAEKIDASLMSEMQALERVIMSRFSLTETQKALNELYHVLLTYEDFISLEVTRQDAAFFYGHQTLFDSEKLRDRLQSIAVREGVEFPESLPVRAADEALMKAEVFYRTALKRDQVLVEKTLKKMREENKNVSILVTGGFHTAGIESFLRERKLSYVTLTPRVTGKIKAEQDKRLYQEVLHDVPLQGDEILNRRDVQIDTEESESSYQLSPWLLTPAQGEQSRSGRTLRLFQWLAVMESIFEEGVPQLTIEDIRKEMAINLSESDRGSLDQILQEIEGGVLENRDSATRVYWSAPRGSSYSRRVIARLPAEEGGRFRRTIGARSAGIEVPMPTGNILWVTDLDDYLVPGHVKSLYENEGDTDGVNLGPENTDRLSGVKQTAVFEGRMRSDLRIEAADYVWTADTASLYEEDADLLKQVLAARPELRITEQLTAADVAQGSELKVTLFRLLADGRVILGSEKDKSEKARIFSVKAPTASGDRTFRLFVSGETVRFFESETYAQIKKALDTATDSKGRAIAYGDLFSKIGGSETLLLEPRHYVEYSRQAEFSDPARQLEVFDLWIEGEPESVIRAALLPASNVKKLGFAKSARAGFYFSWKDERYAMAVFKPDDFEAMLPPQTEKEIASKLEALRLLAENPAPSFTEMKRASELFEDVRGLRAAAETANRSDLRTPRTATERKLQTFLRAEKEAETSFRRIQQRWLESRLALLQENFQEIKRKLETRPEEVDLRRSVQAIMDAVIGELRQLESYFIYAEADREIADLFSRQTGELVRLRDEVRSRLPLRNERPAGVLPSTDEVVRNPQDGDESAQAMLALLNLRDIKEAVERLHGESVPPEALAVPTPGFPYVDAAAYIISIGIAVAAGVLNGALIPGILSAIGVFLVTRTAYVVSKWINEAAHLIGAATFGAGKGLLTWKNLTGNRSLLKWTGNIFVPMTEPPYVRVPALEAAGSGLRHHLVRSLGWLTNLGLSAGIIAFLVTAGADPFVFQGIQGLAVIGLGSVFALIEAVISDLLTPAEPGIYCCGNTGSAHRVQDPRAEGTPRDLRDRSLIPAWLDELNFKMERRTVTRGEQAEGKITYVERGDGTMVPVYHRSLKRKRGDLPVSFQKKFTQLLRSTAWRERLRRPFSGVKAPKIIRIQTHLRYGTSSAPAVVETQPHTWLPPRMVRAWKVEEGGVKNTPLNLSTFLSHNGDFDSWQVTFETWNVFGKDVPFDVLGKWLAKVLGKKHYASGDTPKLAGVLDYVLTQGLWDASFRFAFQERVAESLDDNAPAQKLLTAWGKTADRALQTLVDEGSFNPRLSLSRATAEERDRVRSTVESAFDGDESFNKWVPAEKRAAFFDQAVAAFLDHDVYTAVKLTKKRARGSFGVVVTSSLEPDKVVFAAHLQPLSFGYDPELDLVVWGSEAGAVGSKFAVDGEIRSVPYRFDLNQETGEIVELRMEDDAFIHDSDPWLGVRIYSESKKRELTAEEVRKTRRVIDRRDNPLIDEEDELTNENDTDKDIREIPYVVREVSGDFDNPESFNRQTAAEFFRLLVEKDIGKRIHLALNVKKIPDDIEVEIHDRAIEITAALMSDDDAPRITPEEFRKRIDEAIKEYTDRIRTMDITQLVDQDKEYDAVEVADVIVNGIEISQWLGEQFAFNFTRLFPSLKIDAVSSNKILEALSGSKLTQPMREFLIMENNRTLKVNKNTIVLSISQSGQTFPSLNATIALKRIIPDRVFVLTGGVDTLMGRAVGQQYYKGAKFTGRIFDNKSGYRPAEPSSVAAASTHQVLTELLLFLGEQMKALHPERHPLGLIYEPEDFDVLRKIRNDMLNDVIPALVGRSSANPEDIVSSSRHKQLLQLAKRWGRHIVEAAFALGITAFIVAVFNHFGLPFFPTSWPFVPEPSVGLSALLSLFDASAPEFVGSVLNFVIFIPVNMVYFLMFPWLVSMGLRVLQSRYPLLARTGKRTITLGDIPYVHQLLEAYVSKLFALSYGFASVDVHGANARDHFLHRFGHRVVRGSLSLLFRPLGGLHSFSAAQKAVEMTRGQEEGIQNFKVGAEVFMIGNEGKGKTQTGREKEILLPEHRTPILAPYESFVRSVSKKFGLNRVKAKKLTDAITSLGSRFQGVPLYQVSEKIAEELELPAERRNEFETEFLRYGRRQYAIELFYESRYDSFERLISGYVIFGAMARYVARFFRWIGLVYNWAASQSRTRVASTASPVSASAVDNILSQLPEVPQPEIIENGDGPSPVPPFRVLTTEQLNGNTGVSAPRPAETSELVEPAAESAVIQEVQPESNNVSLETIEAELKRAYAANLPFARSLSLYVRKLDQNLRRQIETGDILRTPEGAPAGSEDIKAWLDEELAWLRAHSAPEIASLVSGYFENLSAAGLRGSETRRSDLRTYQDTFEAAAGETDYMNFLALTRRLFPRIAEAESRGVDVVVMAQQFTSDEKILARLGLSLPSEADTPGYYVLDYESEADDTLIKRLAAESGPGLKVVVFAGAERRAYLSSLFEDEVAADKLVLPSQALEPFIRDKMREMELSAAEVLKLASLISGTRLKHEYREAMALAAVKLAPGRIVVRTDKDLPWTRSLFFENIMDSILDRSFELVSRSA